MQVRRGYISELGCDLPHIHLHGPYGLYLSFTWLHQWQLEGLVPLHLEMDVLDLKPMLIYID
jgi:hypothetical protein